MTDTEDSDSHARVLAEEAAYVLGCYAALDAMRQSFEASKEVDFAGAVYADGYGMGVDRKNWKAHLQRAIEDLAATDRALCFGRIDDGANHSIYVGRRHVQDAAGVELVTDWRAPVSAPFYRATVLDSMGLSLRRRFITESSALVDYFDEDFSDPASVDAGAYVPDPLLAEIGRSRTGHMRDIIATIQAEQDVIIRAPVTACIVVQGGPGTGKTAVGLHRAAFLLYENRSLLEQNPLLVLGPNQTFLEYISEVLPSLGERTVRQTTLQGLMGGRARATSDDRTEVARLKGDLRMIPVIEALVDSQLVYPSAEVEMRFEFGIVRVPAEPILGLMRSLAVSGPRNLARIAFRDRLASLAWEAFSAKSSSFLSDSSGFLAKIKVAKDFKSFVDKAWPSLTDTKLLRVLYSRRPLLRQLAAGVLSAAECELLYRKPAAASGREVWSRSDLALLDEINTRLNGVDHTYGHVVIDEAQDLSPMELRMASRRSRRGSMTILGDIAQGTAPAAQESWPDACNSLVGASSPRVVELHTGYRVPEPILRMANQLLPYAAPSLRPTGSARVGGPVPTVRRILKASLCSEVVSAVLGATSLWSSVGVIAPDAELDLVSDALRRAEVEFKDIRRGTGLGGVTLLSPYGAKGLEFDFVVVAEPQLIFDGERGARLLYIALTRAVQDLTVLYSGALPEVFTIDSDVSSGLLQEVSDAF